MTATNSLRIAGVSLGLLAMLGLTSCQTAQTALQDRTTRDALIGGLVGAAAGAAIDSNKRGRGALIGAVVGGLAGGAIGNYLDKQAAEIQDAIPDATLEGRGDTLIVGFAGDLLFSSGSSSLSPGAVQRLNSLGNTLVRYPESQIIVKGHTDSVGDESLNLRLSDQRAHNVKNLMIGQGVADYRGSLLNNPAVERVKLPLELQPVHIAGADGFLVGIKAGTTTPCTVSPRSS